MTCERLDFPDDARLRLPKTGHSFMQCSAIAQELPALPSSMTLSPLGRAGHGFGNPAIRADASLCVHAPKDVGAHVRNSRVRLGLCKLAFPTECWAKIWIGSIEALFVADDHAAPSDCDCIRLAD